MNGEYWVALYAKILENHFLQNDNNAFLIFVKVLLMVSPNTGEMSCSLSELAKRANLPRGTVYDTLQRLQKQGMLVAVPAGRYTIIRVSNWDKYKRSKARAQQGTKQQTKQLPKQTLFANNDELPDYKALAPKQHAPPAQTIAQTQTQMEPKRRPNDRLKITGAEKALRIRTRIYIDALQSFVDFRADVKKPMTPKALEIVLRNLDKWYPGDEAKQIACMEQSIASGYQGVFPLKGERYDTAAERKRAIF
jgi:hypothetical protein